MNDYKLINKKGEVVEFDSERFRLIAKKCCELEKKGER